MGMKFETSWGVDPKIFKNTLVERVFEKMVSNLSILEGIFEEKFQSWFFYEKNLQGFLGFPSFFENKFKGIFLQKNFVKRFPCKFTPWLVLHVLHFIGDFFIKPDLVLHVLHFIGISFITKRVTCLKRGSHTVLSHPRYRPPTPLVVMKKWRVFGPLFFSVSDILKWGLWVTETNI